MPPPLLEVLQLSKRFHRDAPWVVEAVSFQLAPAEILVLLGPSGCGKTTTLRIIAGLERPDAGRVLLEGQPLTRIEGEGAGKRPLHLPPERRRIGLVFQDYALFPHLSVLENVTFGLKGPRATRRRRAMEMLQRVALAEMADRKPQTLSGGQQQRVALARTLAPAPPVILLDEPFSNLDAELRQATRREVRELLIEQQTAAILVTHDQEEALSFGDRIVVMHQGRVQQVGTPEEIYRSPANPLVAALLGQTNLMEVQASGQAQGDSPLGPIPLDRPATGRVQIALRPEQIVFHSSDYTGAAGAAGRVVSRQYCGHDQLYRFRLGDLELLVRTDDRCTLQVGDEARIGVRDAAVVVS